jgi:hypothetical protein
MQDKIWDKHAHVGTRLFMYNISITVYIVRISLFRQTRGSQAYTISMSSGQQSINQIFISDKNCLPRRSWCCWVGNPVVNSSGWAPWLRRKWSPKAYLRWFVYRLASKWCKEYHLDLEPSCPACLVQGWNSEQLLEYGSIRDQAAFENNFLLDLFPHHERQFLNIAQSVIDLNSRKPSMYIYSVFVHKDVNMYFLKVNVVTDLPC